jgi:GGDEF domain-containing protein
VLLTDLGSANGTFVNDRRVVEPETPLAKEDMLRVGNSILKFLPAGEIEIVFYGNLGAAANTDPLTRIYNKGYLLEALGAEWKRAKALHTDFSLIFLDLDHFKNINDTCGHDAGDEVLKEVARLIRNDFVRPRDIFARYGGEEFALLLPNTSGRRRSTSRSAFVRLWKRTLSSTRRSGFPSPAAWGWLRLAWRPTRRRRCSRPPTRRAMRRKKPAAIE